MSGWQFGKYFERLWMAIGWISVLQSVPWGDVVSNAPKVAAGARRLWKTVAAKPSVAPAGKVTSGSSMSQSPEAQAVSALKARVLELESVTLELKQQMVESSGLITALAEQNNQLIIRFESVRLRMLWLIGALVLVCASATAGVAFMLNRV